MTLEEAVKRDVDKSLEEWAKYFYSLGYEAAKSEIVHCKDCKYWPNKAITYASADPYLESYPHCFHQDGNWYCGDAEKEEE